MWNNNLTRKNKRFMVVSRKSPPRWPSTIRNDGENKSAPRWIVLFAVVGAWLYLLFYSPWFSVSAVEVSGPRPDLNNKIKDAVQREMSGKRHRVLPQNNIFLFALTDAPGISRSLGLAGVYYSKNFFDRAVFVNYEGRQPVAILSLPEGQFRIDYQGEQIDSADVSNLDPNLPIIFADQDSVDAGMINGTTLSAIRKIKSETDELSLKVVSYKIQPPPEIPIKEQEEMPVPEAPAASKNESTKTIGSKAMKEVKEEPMTDEKLESTKELVLTTTFGWRIYLGGEIFRNLSGLDQQLYNLKVFSKEKFKKINPRQMQYIDLRFGDRVYYK